MELKDKVVIITGAGSGIGAATAKAFAQEGCRLVINTRKNIKGAEEVVEECKNLGSNTVFVKGDVSVKEDVSNIFETARKKFGMVDILINNAGEAKGDRVTFMEAEVENWIDDFKDDLFGTMLCSQFAAKIMKEKGSGKIINTSSIRGLEHGGREGIMAYSAAKAGVINFTKTLAKLMSPNVQVNAIAPGFVWTKNYEGINEDSKRKFLDDTALKRWIDVDEIAQGFIYLAKADAITGHILTIDAGWSLKL